MPTHPEALIARAADGGEMSDADQRALERHLEACPSCRDALEAQRLVSRMLHARIEAAPAPGFAARVSARLDREVDGGILDLANWRAWTVGLVPVAAALMLAAWLDLGASQTAPTAQPTADSAVTFEAWTTSAAGTSPAAVFLQPSASSDQLLETVLTGAAPSAATGAGHVR